MDVDGNFTALNHRQSIIVNCSMFFCHHGVSVFLFCRKLQPDNRQGFLYTEYTASSKDGCL